MYRKLIASAGRLRQITGAAVVRRPNARLLRAAAAEALESRCLLSGYTTTTPTTVSTSDASGVYGGSTALSASLSTAGSSVGIGVNFTGTSGQNGISLLPTEVAGVDPLGNYNNFSATTGVLDQITDSTGNLIQGASLGVSASGPLWSGDVNSVPATADGELMKGGLTSGGYPDQETTYTVSVTLPPALFAAGGQFASGFDLIALSQNNSPNDYMVSSFTVDGITLYVENAPFPDGGPTFDGTYTQSTLTSYPADNAEIGNYVRFDHLSQSALSNNILTIAFSTLNDASGSANGYERGEFNGFELVPAIASTPLAGEPVIFTINGSPVGTARAPFLSQL